MTCKITFQPTSPIRSEIDFKLGGTQCNVIMSRLTPWIELQSLEKKSMVLQDGNPNPERLRSTKSEMFMWACTVSAPEMTIVLYDLRGSSLYHVSDIFNSLFLWVVQGDCPVIQIILWCIILTSSFFCKIVINHPVP